MKLTKRQKVFVEHYLQCWNATQAAIKAGYSSRSAYSIGSENLRKPDIKAYIDERLTELKMGADEALLLLADQARGDLGDFMDISSVGFHLDLVGKNTRLLKKIKQKTITFIAKKESDEDREVTETEIEIYDAQGALDKILKVHGAYKNQILEELPLLVFGVGKENDGSDPEH